MTPIRKAVFPVAGLGSRFLPATKAMPKEMLPVVDRPLIQHVVDEAREAGLGLFIFATGRNKGVIEDHFDRQFELEHMLTERQRHADLEALARDLPGPGTASFTRQQFPLGLGHAVWGGGGVVGGEPFAVLLPDVLVQHNRGCLAQMIDAARGLGENANIIAVEQMPAERLHMYGVVGVGERRGGLFSITQPVEKPAREGAPSNLIITGRYILQPGIFDILAAEKRGAGGEIQLTDAMIELAKMQPFYGLEFQGRSFDCGSKETVVVGAYACDTVRAEERVNHKFAGNLERERPADSLKSADGAGDKPSRVLTFSAEEVFIHGSLSITTKPQHHNEENAGTIPGQPGTSCLEPARSRKRSRRVSCNRATVGSRDKSAPSCDS